MTTKNMAHLLPTSYKGQVINWLKEDCPSFDYAGFVVGEAPRRASLLAKSSGVLAGVSLVTEIFTQLGCEICWHYPEGALLDLSSSLDDKTEVATVSGPARNILLGERVALNTLARCSGIATQSQHIVSLARRAGYTGIIAGTRKTTPGFRLVEKYGMLVGGADCHRMDLSAMIMLKDNHIWSRGSIEDAVKEAKLVGGFTMKVEVEVQSEQEAEEAIVAGVDVVMLDNFTAQEVANVAGKLKGRWAGKDFLLEVSGDVTADNIEAYACKDVDIISTSSIHQGYPLVDFSLKIKH